MSCEIHTAALSILELIRRNEWDSVIDAIHASSLRFQHPSLNVANVHVDKSGKILIHFACLHNAPIRVVKELIRVNPYGPSTRSKVGCLAIFAALKAGSEADIKLIRLLLNSPGVQKLLMEKNINGLVPLHFGAMHGVSVDILREVLHASPRCALVPASSMGGFTPMAAYWYRIRNCKAGKPAFKSLWRYYMSSWNKERLSILTNENHNFLIKSWDIIRIFLQAGCFEYKSGDELTTSPLSLMNSIVELGCHPNMMMLALYVCSKTKWHYSDASGRTPLVIALENVGREPTFVTPSNGPCDMEDDDEGSDVDETYALDDDEGVTEVKNICDGWNIDNISMTESIMLCHPNFSRIKTSKGCYPIHIAIAVGLEWENGLNAIVQGYPNALSIWSPTQLLPFMEAGAVNLSLDTIFHLLSADPCALSRNKYAFKTLHSKKRKDHP